jgi:hypothetical protein
MLVMSICFSSKEDYRAIRRDGLTMPDIAETQRHISEVVAGGGAIAESSNAAPTHGAKAHPLDAVLGQ